VPGAIVELALLFAAEQAGDHERAFFEEAMRLRDLLKYEFFFAEKEAFRAELSAELAEHAPGWREELASGRSGVDALLKKIRPFSAHRTLRPFLEAYALVADALTRADESKPVGEELLGATLALGQQYFCSGGCAARSRSRRCSSRARSSSPRIAGSRNRARAVVLRRRAFAESVRGVLRRVDAIAALAAGRRAGLIP